VFCQDVDLIEADEHGPLTLVVEIQGDSTALERCTIRAAIETLGAYTIEGGTFAVEISEEPADPIVFGKPEQAVKLRSEIAMDAIIEQLGMLTPADRLKLISYIQANVRDRSGSRPANLPCRLDAW
jgi:hypothetical protein